MMKRWNSEARCLEKIPAADAFIDEVIAVCRKHGFSLGHEDGHGAFLIQDIEGSEHNFAWLREAHFEASQRDPTPQPAEPDRQRFEDTLFASWVPKPDRNALFERDGEGYRDGQVDGIWKGFKMSAGARTDDRQRLSGTSMRSVIVDEHGLPDEFAKARERFEQVAARVTAGEAAAIDELADAAAALLRVAK
jgi:hypothetical protein